jgi:transcriptional regulator with XRE-family HTH domain
VGSAQDFLGLTDGEATIVELKLAMAKTLKARRQSSRLSQEELAKLLESSQSRVAKMEAADRSVSLELLLRALLRLGTTKREIAQMIEAAP